MAVFSKRWRGYAVLFCIAFALRLIISLFITEPGYTDAYYYYLVGDSIAQGKGAVEPAVWTYIGLDQLPSTMANAVTKPANSYWMPLAEWLATPGLWLSHLLGIQGAGAYWLASLPFLLLAALIPPITLYMGRLIFGGGPSGNRRAWLAACFSLFAGRFFVLWNSIDNFAPFAVLTSGALIVAWLGVSNGRKGDRWLIVAGVLTALAYLSRADGLILAPAILVVFVWQRQKQEPEQRARWSRLAIGFSIIGLTFLSWTLRTYMTFGFVSPQTGATAYFRNYDEVFAYAVPLSPAYYLNQIQPAATWGIGPLLGSKVEGLWNNFFILAIQSPLFLAPLGIIGLLVRPDLRPRFRRGSAAPLWAQPVFQGFCVFAILIYLLMALVFTFPSIHGTLFHATGGLVPFQAVCCALGVEWVAGLYVGRLGRRRRRVPLVETAPFVQRIYVIAGGLTLFLGIAGTVILAQSTLRQWDDDFTLNSGIAAWFSQHPELLQTPLITSEPLGYYYVAHTSAIALASDGVAANIAAARRFGVTYLALGRGHYPALDRLYTTHSLNSTGDDTSLHFITQLPDGTQIYSLSAKP